LSESETSEEESDGSASDDVLRSAFEQAAIGMAIVSTDGRLVRVNRAFARLVGEDQAALTGRPLLGLCHPSDVAGIDARLKDLTAGVIDHVRLEARCLSTTSVVDVCLTFSAVKTSGRAYVMAQAEDISHRKRAEERLERYRLLAERARDIILFIALDGRIIEANDAAVQAYGYTRDELLTMSIRDLRAGETKSLIAPQMETADEHGILFETMHQRKDGSTFPVQVSSQGAKEPGARVLLSIIRDVTDRKRMHDQLMHADRLVALGTLTASIVHEINNPLGYVLTNLELATKASRRSPNAQLESFLADAREGAERMRGIVQSTRALLRSEDQPWRQVDVRDVLEGTLQMTWLEIRDRANLVREYGEVPPVAAMESQLGQVFLNLVINAVQALPEDDPEHNELRLVTYTTPTGAACVEVRDTGSGMSPATLDHIFDPFFTTKPAGIGTGLGLSICQGILTAMGGSISVESQLGRGSVFRVTLPAAPCIEGHGADPQGTSSPPSPVEAPKDSEVRPRPRMHEERKMRGRVLVIDDEPALCTTIRHVMALDHDVVTAASALEALSILERDRMFDVVFCDVHMPEMTGVELHARVRKLDAELAERFVFLTGGDVLPEGDLPRSIAKPFHLQELQNAVDAKLRRG
jgi:PAS domain S-box-containing protein